MRVSHALPSLTLQMVQLVLVASFPTLGAAAAAESSTSIGMAGYWAFDEGRGDRADDALRGTADIFGNTGQARILAPAWVRGKYGQAMDFSSGRTAVTVEKTKKLNCDRQVTVAAWIKLGPPTKGRGMIVNHGYAYRLSVRRGQRSQVEFQLNLDGNWAGNWLLGKTSLKPGRWYHVAGVYDGRERRIYIDGQLDASEAVQGTLGDGRHFLIGGAIVKRGKKRVFKHGETVDYQVQEAFPGTIDEVRVWSRALSLEDVVRTRRENRFEVQEQLPKERDLYFYPVRCVTMLGENTPYEFVVWARHVDQALGFTSWLAGQPAAAATIEVFEVDGRLPARPASRVSSHRLIGHFWEDAQPLSRCFGGNAPDLMDFDRVARNLCDYFGYTGQNLLMHPVVWYEGPIYNSLVETRGAKGGFYFPTAGWIDILLERFEERGFKFYGLFNVHQLPSLMRTMNADTAKIQAGEPTFNTVSKDNQAAVKTWHHRASMFNALHPRVQERVLALVRELADRYAASSAFAGLGFHLTLAQLLQPGSLDVSYDDWTVGEFEKDTGIAVPVARRDPERFGKRYDWIMKNARDEWIRWRCERVADYYGKIAAILRDRRADLQFVVTLLEPPMSIIDSQRIAWLEGKSLVEQAREAGIAPLLLARHSGLVIQQRLGPSAKRKRLTFGTTRGRHGYPPPTPENIDAIRGMDLDAQQQQAFRTTANVGVFLYNRYFESAVGRQHPLESEWYESIPWRATAVVPAHEHFMEYYAQAMAMFDPTILAIGGFTNGTVGHASRVERFARIFRQLPTGNWQDIPGLGHDVVGRTMRVGETLYLYAVNTSARKQRVVLKTATPMRPIAASPQLPRASGDGRAVELAPYQLAAWVEER